MVLNASLKRLMLNQVKTVLLTPPVKLIQFFDKDDISLANIPYTDIVEKSGLQYWFQQNSSDILSSSILAPGGVVAKFKIDGQDGMTLIPDAITGTVGNYASNADIKFNNTTWVTYSLVKLNSLYFFIR
jgi:hypothetical protein